MIDPPLNAEQLKQCPVSPLAPLPYPSPSSVYFDCKPLGGRIYLGVPRKQTPILAKRQQILNSGARAKSSLPCAYPGSLPPPVLTSLQDREALPHVGHLLASLPERKRVAFRRDPGGAQQGRHVQGERDESAQQRDQLEGAHQQALPACGRRHPPGLPSPASAAGDPEPAAVPPSGSRSPHPPAGAPCKVCAATASTTANHTCVARPQSPPLQPLQPCPALEGAPRILETVGRLQHTVRTGFPRCCCVCVCARSLSLSLE